MHRLCSSCISSIEKSNENSIEFSLSNTNKGAVGLILALELASLTPFKSPMAAPVFFIKKKDGSLRLVQDYRVLNFMMVKNKYPLPLISELVSQLRGARYFTKLDVRWGFNNIRIKPGDKWKVAFQTNQGLFEPLVMFFRMTNSLATFQTMMNNIFRNLIAEGIVVVYLDDILIFTKMECQGRNSGGTKVWDNR